MNLLFEILSIILKIAMPIFVNQLSTKIYDGAGKGETELRLREKLRKEGWIR